MNRILKTVVLVGALALAASACQNDSASQAERAVSNRQLDTYLRNQPVPFFEFSQLRQNLIDIETAQSETTATTSFMFARSPNGTTGSLVHWCPSIGFPIPATYNLTNPLQPSGYQDNSTIAQLEATGVFTGDTSGTYVICVDAKGKGYAFYHEGDVSTITGPAHWDIVKGEIVLDGASSFDFTTKVRG